MILWPDDHVIPMLGVTGEFGTGKTKMLLSLAPPRRTLILDTEMSSKDTAAYEKMGLTRIDVPALMYERHPKGHTSLQLFEWFIEFINSIDSDQYDVIAIDTANDFESGLTEWVASRHDEFRYSSAHTFRSMKGVFFGIVKDEWQKIKLRIAQKCQTFAFANHMRDKYVGDESTGEREAKGKDTFYKLSSLYLEMKYDVDDEAPSAIIKKSRLDRTVFDDNEIAKTIPIFRKGQRIANASGNTIREYIKNPVGERELRPDELPKEARLSDDERLKMETEKARNERISAERSVEAIKEAKELEAQKATARQRAFDLMRPGLQPAKKKEEQEEPQSEPNPVRDMIKAAEAKGKDIKERVIKAIQYELEDEPTGTLTRGQAKRIDQAMIDKYMDGITKVKKIKN